MFKATFFLPHLRRRPLNQNSALLKESNKMLIFKLHHNQTGPEYLPQHLDMKPLTFRSHMRQKSKESSTWSKWHERIHVDHVDWLIHRFNKIFFLLARTACRSGSGLRSGLMMGKLTLDDSKTPATPKIPLALHFHSITHKVRDWFCCIEMRAVVSSQVWSPRVNVSAVCWGIN